MSWAYSTGDKYVDYSANTHASISTPSIVIPAGALVVAFATYDFAGGDKNLTVSDGTNNFTKATGGSVTETVSNQRSEGYYYINHPGGTLAITASTASTISYSELLVAVYTGIATSSAFDNAVTNTQAGALTTTDFVTSGNITTAQANELLVGWHMASNGGVTVSAGTGLTSRQTGAGSILQDKNVATASTTTSTATISGVDNVGSIAMAFKEPAAGGTTLVNLEKYTRGEFRGQY